MVGWMGQKRAKRCEEIGRFRHAGPMLPPIVFPETRGARRYGGSTTSGRVVLAHFNR